jgi:sugar/nucleoside kinase (ribokinase family)
MPKFDVSSIGFYVLDILGRPVSRIPEGGRADYIEEIRMTVAGTAGATGMDCAILGLKTQAVTTVGTDDMGDWFVAKLKKYGLDCEMVRRDGSVQTSSTILPVRPNGERPALHVPGTAAVFRIADEDLDAALDATVVHVGGTGLLKSFDGEPTVRLLKRAKELGRTTTFDLIQATPETIALVEPCLPYIDYFVPSIDEASEMAHEKDPAKVAAYFQGKGVRNCILTLGGDGVYVAPLDGEAFHLPAFDINVVDTTGCGDSFTAGIIVGIVKGWDLKQSARFASAVAARVATGLGSDGKLTSFDDTLQAMNSLPVKTPAHSYARA